MHQLLIEITQACLEEARIQAKMSLNEENFSQLNQVLLIEQALLPLFEGQVKSIFGVNYCYTSAKLRTMVENIKEIRRLIWILLNSDCVTFFTVLTDIRSSDSVDGNCKFSIFRYCDANTQLLIDKLTQLAKSRIWRL